ncbi:unnamed protein product [Fraxinus pennsylvanica]|uniref:Sm protein G n=1 Tax=Fraxinus pennsylvanica TaxID=56036 RepID=A0AAD2A9C7_9LAMI|nr:unnamed protein product [Fraxinus pennsylvanica]
MVVGTLRGFDQFMNLVVNTVEVNGNEKNKIGMVVIRGNSVVTVEALEPVSRPQTRLSHDVVNSFAGLAFAPTTIVTAHIVTTQSTFTHRNPPLQPTGVAAQPGYTILTRSLSSCRCRLRFALGDALSTACSDEQSCCSSPPHVKMSFAHRDDWKKMVTIW